MRAETKELWLELCVQAANEQDADKLLAMVREINAALELKIRRLQRILCHNPVPLDTSKTDENGKAIHEECYVLKLRLKRATSKSDDVHS